jgi:hypothetical protein
MAALAEKLLSVTAVKFTMDEPKKLPHHQPELAAAHVFFIYSKELFELRDLRLK